MRQLSLARQTLGLAGWLLVSFTAAGVGAFASAGADAFYRQLIRPDWAPPGWVFAPVWSTLYLLIGIAAWLVWREHGLRGARQALALFVIQLAANALWTWLFFVWRTGALAFVEALALFALVVVTLVAFWRERPLAGVLLLPYAAWVGFACVLTLAVWRLNPDLLG